MLSRHSPTACGGTGAITPTAGVWVGPTTAGTGAGAAGMVAGTAVGMPAGVAGTADGAGVGPITTIRTTIRVGIIRDPATGLRATRTPRAARRARVVQLQLGLRLMEVVLYAVVLLPVQRMDVVLLDNR